MIARDDVRKPTGPCKTPSGGLFEALSFSQDLIVSGIEVTKALPDKALVQKFYREMPLYSMRPGPLKTDQERLTSLIEYSSEPYLAPAFLVAPPLVRVQQRLEQEACTASFGRVAHAQVRSTANLTRCQSPFKCSDVSGPTSLLSCTSSESSPTHFGRGPMPEGQVWRIF